MPRMAMATSAAERIADSDDEASTTRVDDLIQRGRSQGHLSLAELRTAFDQAGLTPAEGRSILRELSEAGVRLANELAQHDPAQHDPAQIKGSSKGRQARSAPARNAKQAAGAAAPGSDQAEDADVDLADADVVNLEAEAAALSDADKLAEVDLDDQTPAMGDSVHTYLKSIGRTSLLTAEQEVDLAKRIEAGLFAEHKLDTDPLTTGLD
jgi:RNA polymerase primary sigma factor